MKIRRQSDALATLTAQDVQLQKELQGAKNRSQNPLIEEEQEATKTGESKVNISSSLLIQQQLAPETLAQERAQKVQVLKELVQSGKYFEGRSSKDIASAVLDGINDEVSLLKLFSDSSEE